jgi:hypothetical protein
MDPGLLTPSALPQGQTVYLLLTLEPGLRLGAPPTFVQIDVPKRLPLALRHAFERGHRRLVLLIAASQERLPAMLAEFGDTALTVDTDASTLWRKPGERVVVIFPTPGLSYVMQTVIEAVAVQRLTLRYQDPRYDVRRHVPVMAPVTLCLVPGATVEAIERRQVRLVRAIKQPVEGKGSDHVIAERLMGGSVAAPGPTLPGLHHVSTLIGGLKDLSLGGAAVTCADPLFPEILAHCMIRLQIALPELPLAPPEPAALPLRLDLFGIIRQVETTSSPRTLHLRFLVRLPEACAIYIERLGDHLRSSLSD